MRLTFQAEKVTVTFFQVIRQMLLRTVSVTLFDNKI